MSDINITIREYHPESGAFLGNISVLDLGKIEAGSRSQVKVIDYVFEGASSVSNIKLGIISNGGLVVNEGPVGIDSNGTSSNGHFGIETSSSFVSSKAMSPLVRHFAGVNESGTSDNQFNVKIGNRSPNVSNYIYLDVETGSGNALNGNGAYKLFFDYA